MLLMVILAGGAALPALAQQAVEAQSQRPAYGTDPRARAKIHTEPASLYFQDGNLAVALEELGVAIHADPGYAPAYNVRGLVRAYLRELTLAEEDFKKALGLASNDPEINNNYGWFLCENGKPRQAISYFLNAIKNPLYTTPDLAYANAGSCAVKAGDLEGAENYLTTAIRLNGPAALAFPVSTWPTSSTPRATWGRRARCLPMPCGSWSRRRRTPCGSDCASSENWAIARPKAPLPRSCGGVTRNPGNIRSF